MVLNSHDGFTLVELVVVSAIVMVITAVVLSNLPSIRAQISLDVLTHDIALAIREAQTYSLGFLLEGGAGQKTYGIYFDKNSPNEFIFFSDNNDNYRYDSGEKIRTTLIKGGQQSYEIIKLCANEEKVTPCQDSSAGEKDKINIAFERPDPEAKISNCVSLLCGSADNTNAEIVIGDKLGTKKRSIRIWNTGQISVIK